MRFKRIDVDTVRCIISEEELMENGLEVDDFLQNDGRTESFLRKIISMAEEEVGYKVQGGNITIQVAVLPEHTLALTFSEKPELGISNMLENLKSAVESLVKNAPDIEKLKQTSKELANQNHTDEGIAEIQISCGVYSLQDNLSKEKRMQMNTSTGKHLQFLTQMAMNSPVFKQLFRNYHNHYIQVESLVKQMAKEMDQQKQ